jgi:hypothetical protein
MDFHPFHFTPVGAFLEFILDKSENASNVPEYSDFFGGLLLGESALGL